MHIFVLGPALTKCGIGDGSGSMSVADHLSGGQGSPEFVLCQLQSTDHQFIPRDQLRLSNWSTLTKHIGGHLPAKDSSPPHERRSPG